ncbi:MULTISPECIES: preprotein translocase subunit SecE [unclassified Lysobacter]|uniref:preprotein translocase subunit SecE n=1 Tax=unclassified Lysobacter TaxID=2635362 RepID=UPI0006F8EB2B|nr:MULTISPECIES: preprotein translocase subunit SecE [unclassified Lysobacter]KQZ62201.1 preprotein translocase subunit SecE [Lysobacter sp. Root559]KRA78870.1 preprotein translocase subunit SecE [Lysobacter sp. Root667]KRC37190.1 preprotein translocase subunit SecE [Lysobacter sp. Root76]KRD64611.1 preprotein translocase subunit SecE [Lysobacter sp. Root96]
MNSKVEQHGSASAGDFLKYALAVLLVGGGVFAFYWFADWAAALRALVVVAGLVAGIGVFLTSAKGRQTLEFLSESRFELRKVVWPTRQEAMRTTWVVMIAVAILSLILAGFDLLIQAAVKFILGH